MIGSMEDLAQAELGDIEEFFLAYYRPNNAVLTLAGDFDSEQAFDRVRHYFDEIPRGASPPPIPGRTEIAARSGPLRARVEADVPLPRAYLAARIPSFTDPEFVIADVATSILGDGRASRLYRKLVRERRIAKDVVSFAAPLVTGSSFMVVWVTGLQECEPETLELALEEEIDAMVEVEQEEVERAVARAETQLLRGVESLAGRADLLSMYQMVFDDANRLNSELDRLRRVTSKDVREFAKTSLGSDTRAMLTYSPKPSE